MKKSRRKDKKPAGAAVVHPALNQSLVERFNAFADGAQGRRLIPAFVVLCTLLVGTWTFDPKLSLSGDNTEFITLARSLAQGEGLVHLNDPNPQPATKYPFGFPLLLAPVELLFPGEWTPMKAWVLLLFSVGMGMLYLLMRDRMGALPSIAVVGLSLTAGQSYLTTDASGHHFGPLLLHFSHQVMSEAPFLTVSLAALWLLQRGVQREGIRGNRELLAGFGLAVFAYYIRSVGITLLGAIIVYLFLQRDIRRGLIFSAASLLAWLPWTLRNRAVGGGGVYFQQLIQVNPYYPDQGLLDVVGFFGRLTGNGAAYLNVELPRLLWPFFSGDGAFGPVSVFIILLAAYTLMQALRFRRDVLLVLYTAFTIGVALLWFWVDARFLFGVVPLFIYFAVRAVNDLADGISAHGGPWTGRALRWGLLVAVVWGQVPGVSRLAEYSRADYPPAWSRYYQAGQWLKEHTNESAIVLCRKGYWMYIVSGRRAVGFPFEDPSAIMAHMEQQEVDYVVLESLGFAQTARYLAPAVNEHMDRFSIAWKDETVPTYVLKLDN